MARFSKTALAVLLLAAPAAAQNVAGEDLSAAARRAPPASSRPAPAPTSTPQLTADRWEAHLRISDGTSRTRLSVGMRPEATDAYDVLHDVRALFGDGIRAWFDRAGWPDGGRYIRDVRAGTHPSRFDFVVEPLVAGRTVTLTWDLRFVPTGCPRVDLVLVDDATGARTDLRTASRYTFVPADLTPRALHLETAVVEGDGPTATDVVRVNRTAADHVVVRWTGPAPSRSDVAGYHVYRRDAAGAVVRLTESPVPGPVFHDRSNPGRGAAWFVRAVGWAGCEGAASPTAGLPAPDRRIP